LARGSGLSCGASRRSGYTSEAAAQERPRRADAIGITLDRAGRVLSLEHVEDAF